MKTKRMSVMQLIGLGLLLVLTLAGRDSLASGVTDLSGELMYINDFTPTPDALAWIDADLRMYRAELARYQSAMRRSSNPSLAELVESTRDHIAELVRARGEYIEDRARPNLTSDDFGAPGWARLSRAQRAERCNSDFPDLAHLNHKIEAARRFYRALDAKKVQLEQLQRRIMADRSLSRASRDHLIWRIRSGQLDELNRWGSEPAGNMSLEQMLECRRYVRGPEVCPLSADEMSPLRQAESALHRDRLRQISEGAQGEVVRTEGQLRLAQGEEARRLAYREHINAILGTVTGRGDAEYFLRHLISSEVRVAMETALCRSQRAAPAAAQSDRTVRGEEQATPAGESAPDAASAGSANSSQ